MDAPANVAAPVSVPVERALPPVEDAQPAALGMTGTVDVPNVTAAKVLVEHLFARSAAQINGVEYAVGYRLAHGLTGGDIVDVYNFDNDAVSFSIADISGKGTEAAIHAALVKYGLRAYASQGLTPERVLRSLDRLYIENNAFERIESFASVFFGMVDTSRRMMHYASGGHEAAAIMIPGEAPRLLEPTAPLIGVFDDQHHLFKQSFIELPPGAVFVATTDGITEARDADGAFYGIDRFLNLLGGLDAAPADLVVSTLIDDARLFSDDRLRDDVAVVVARFA